MSGAASLGFAHLAGPLIEGADLAPAVHAATAPLAKQLVASGVDPAEIELAAEWAVRVAEALEDAPASAHEVEGALRALELADEIVQLVLAALATPRSRLEVAALAVHLIDVAEVAALRVFGPELSRLVAKSDRTGDAARRVGVARHLRG